ncbi:hypothetical protein TNCT_726431 [Trichonephila clavata]|uniref:F-box domain-containing protein n=1 Tax=Trichonephila clavata TaxID=2740835 RepID=A0A8X6H551_TRICU|nr:hypothetical protein TNCT_726431 [Trichonephila clavata]
MDQLSEQEILWTVHIDYVPDSVLLDIFDRLSFKELCLCSRVCQRWYILAKDFSLRKRIVIKKPLQSYQFSSLVHHHFTHVLKEFKLLITCGEYSLLSIEKDALWRLALQSNNIKKLVLMSCSLLIVSLKDFPSSLEHLSIRGSEIYPYVFFGQNPSLYVPHLVCLDIGGVSNFLTSQDLHVFSKLKFLRALYMDGCFRVNNGGIESIIDILPQLEVLDVEGTDISDDGVITIFNFCSNIRNLYIGNTSVNDAAFSLVEAQALPHLRTLCVMNTNISSTVLHSFLLQNLSTHELIVRANFKGPHNCKCFYSEKTPVCFELDNESPFPPENCQHYLTNEIYGLN